ALPNGDWPTRQLEGVHEHDGPSLAGEGLDRLLHEPWLVARGVPQGVNNHRPVILPGIEAERRQDLVRLYLPLPAEPPPHPVGVADRAGPPVAQGRRAEVAVKSAGETSIVQGHQVGEPEPPVE